jgi:hypothetical protein
MALNEGAQCAFLGLLLMASVSVEASAGEIKRHFRNLIIFAPEVSSGLLSKQVTVVSKQKDGLMQRRIVVVYVIGKNISAELGPQPDATPIRLRSHYKVRNDEFRVVLQAANGDLEMLSDVPVTSDQLFQITDALPKVEAAAGSDNVVALKARINGR